MSQGKPQPSPTLVDPEDRSKPGRVLVAIDLTSDASAYNLPGGAVADVAVNTDNARLGMKSGLSFVSL